MESYADFMVRGGLFDMTLLSILMAAIMLTSVFLAIRLGMRKATDSLSKILLETVLLLGAFSFFYGLWVQTKGLWGVFEGVVQMGSELSVPMLVGGLQLTLYAPLHGLLNLLLALIIGFPLRVWHRALS